MTARHIIITASALGLVILIAAISGAELAGPHNAANNIGCFNYCHIMPEVKSPYWDHTPADIDDTPTNYLCNSCHTATSGPYSMVNAPKVQTHSSLTTDDGYGNWTTECTDCHNPHYQEQLEWINSGDTGIFVATGSITGYSYNGTTGETTLDYDTAIFYKTGWNAAKLIKKTIDYRSTVLIPDINTLSPDTTNDLSYQVIAVDEVLKKITVKGDASAALDNVTLPSSFGIIYGHLIREYIKKDGYLEKVKFFDGTTTGNGGLTDQSGMVFPKGICQVCHTKTTHWSPTALAAGDVHYPSTPCTDCHEHANGFAHGSGGVGCGTAIECHGTHPAHQTHTGGMVGLACADCHDTENLPLLSDGQDLANTTVCSTCHNDGAGGPPNDTGYVAGFHDGAYNLGCDGCHNGRPNTSDTLVMATNGHDRLVGQGWIRQYPCTYCHAGTVDASWNMTAKHTNGAVDVVMSDQWKIVGQAAPSYDPATKVCANTYCHSDGTTVSPEMRDYPWTGGHEDCNSCHGHDPDAGNCTECHAADAQHTWTPEKKWISAMPMYANTGAGTAKANSHFRHLFTGFSCDDCHADTVVGACLDCHADGIPPGAMGESQHVNGTFHVNKSKTVVFKDGGTYNDTTKTCSATACHSGTDPVWGGSVSSAITCLECHGTADADVDDFGEFNATQARINMTQWATTGHGRTAASGNYDSGNPPAAFPGIGCWYCHDNQVLHQNDDNPFRLRQHDHFANRFQKECVYCHMAGEDAECLGCHDAAESLAPQLATIVAQAGINPPYTISRPDHSGYSSGCSNATCHVNDDTLHKTGAGLWTVDQKEDVKNSYMMMGVCLKCHDDDSGGQCTSCHAAPPDDPVTLDVDESLRYSTGFDPGLAGTTFIKPAQAKASSFHFGYKHYVDYEDSIATALDTGSVSTDAGAVTELTDGSKSWTVDEWAGKSVMMTSGVSIDEMRKIKSNTATVLTLERGFTAPVLTTDNYEIHDPVWKGGKFCWDCHDPHGDDNIYMIQNKVATRTDGTFGRPIDRADVTFTRKQSGLDYARTSAPYDGICNVCHTAGSQHYASDRGDGHNAGRVCTTCHEHRFTDSHSSGKLCNSCHQNKPVPRHAGFGLPRDCTKCHQGAVGKRMDVMGQFNANSHHAQRADGTIKNTDCYQCHWEASENGLINIEHHEGYNYKTHTSVKNAKVDLVIWNGEEIPGGVYDDNDPAVGSRPIVYDLDGTNPDGPGMATVTQFLASNIDTTQPAVALADQRGEVDKVTLHCLGCHSDQNNNSKPFDDCKVPRQYAWDGASIESRYSDTGTTTWGKYSGDKVADKNITKAFSAHGNAVAGGGGWDASTGEDDAIPNTRSGAYNIQCFDCHSSHGSKVTGITSSYTTFNGTKNGANLKETQAGKGGYAMSYKASANPDPSSVNPYNAGAGQCFDCHESANAGTTPWGYSETFGATAPVMGYRDTAHFGQGTRGVNIRYPYKASTIVGGHQKRSSDLSSTPQGTIDGLCSPCHDPHGVSKSLGADRAYAVPLLKGTWMTSPYKEDAANDDATSGRRGAVGVGAPPPTPYVWTDQRTFGGSNTISEDDSKFAGLCLRCHLKDDLTDGIDNNGAWKSVDRIHETVKGWGDNDMHNYTCSKCHGPHNSALPRLMKTNCLQFTHRGQVAFGSTVAASNAPRIQCGNQKNYTGGFPVGSTPTKAAPHQFQVNCHPTGTWPDNSWNNETPW